MNYLNNKTQSMINCKMKAMMVLLLIKICVNNCLHIVFYVLYNTIKTFS